MILFVIERVTECVQRFIGLSALETNGKRTNFVVLQVINQSPMYTNLMFINRLFI